MRAVSCQSSAVRKAFAGSLCLLVALLVSLPAMAQEPAGNQAALIVEYGDGRTESVCVTFAEESITGTDLLLRSGLPVGMDSTALGTSLCQVRDVGCEVGRQACFCQCQGVDCLYWTYFLWQDDAWTYSPLGPSLRQLKDGDADAWVWGDGKTAPQLTPEGVCRAAFTAETAESAEIDRETEKSPVPSATSADSAVRGERRSGLPGCGGTALVLAAMALAATIVLRGR